MGKLMDDARQEAERLIREAEAATEIEDKSRLLKQAQELLAGLDFLSQPAGTNTPRPQ
jgi:hypothetical protein